MTKKKVTILENLQVTLAHCEETGADTQVLEFLKGRIALEEKKKNKDTKRATEEKAEHLEYQEDLLNTINQLGLEIFTGGQLLDYNEYLGTGQKVTAQLKKLVEKKVVEKVGIQTIEIQGKKKKQVGYKLV